MTKPSSWKFALVAGLLLAVSLTSTVALVPPRPPSVAYFAVSSRHGQRSIFRSTRLSLGTFATKDLDDNDSDAATRQPQLNKNKDGNETGDDYKEKLAKLDKAIAEAENERRRVLRAELDRMDERFVVGGDGDATTIDDTNNNLVPVEQWTPRGLQKPPPVPVPVQPQQQSKRTLLTSTRSKVSRSDAGTLVIEITPQGISSGVWFNGAFSVAWFSAIVPATVTALAGGLLGVALFMVPFWAAGGMVAKQAVVDPFVSNTISIGQYAWSVEQRYGAGAKRKGATLKKKEGSTSNLQGAKVECPLIVNNVPQYQLNLYNSVGGGAGPSVISLGQGLPEEELQIVADEINSYLEKLPDTAEDEEFQ